MEARNFIFKAGQGNTTTLDRAYLHHIIHLLNSFDEEKEERWEVYNVITRELVKEGRGDYYTEIKYRITDGEDPNNVILDIIERDISEVNELVWNLKQKIEEYIEEDFFKRFY